MALAFCSVRIAAGIVVDVGIVVDGPVGEYVPDSGQYYVFDGSQYLAGVAPTGDQVMIRVWQ